MVAVKRLAPEFSLIGQIWAWPDAKNLPGLRDLAGFRDGPQNQECAKSGTLCGNCGEGLMHGSAYRLVATVLSPRADLFILGFFQ
jgi:hypothetical protein